MIAALAPDETLSSALPRNILIGERDLQSRVDRLGSGIDEKDMVEIARRKIGNFCCESERFWMSELERWRVIELAGLLADRRDNGIALMAGVAAPQARDAVDDLATVSGDIMHILGTRDETRRGLE